MYILAYLKDGEPTEKEFESRVEVQEFIDTIDCDCVIGVSSDECRDC